MFRHWNIVKTCDGDIFTDDKSPILGRAHGTKSHQVIAGGNRSRGIGKIQQFIRPFITSALGEITRFYISIFHWVILYFRIQVFVSLPYWVWFFHDRESPNSIYLLFLLFLSIGLVSVIFLKPRSNKRNLAMLILLGYVIQVGFGFIEGQGFESIRQKSIVAGHTRYYELAVDNPDLVKAITNYEEAYAWDNWMGTKPPGLISFYIFTQKISNSINPLNHYAGRYLRLTTFATYVFPLLTFLVLIPLFFFSKPFLEEDNAILPCILFLFIPNIILMPLELDQVLFPLLFMLGMIFCRHAISNQSFKWAFACGAMTYIAIYFSFSLLPLLPMTLVWISIDYLQHKKDRGMSDVLKILLGLAIGIILLFLLCRWMLNYDIVIRFQSAMNWHRSLKEFQPGLKQIMDSIILNNLEIASWIGFPMALLAVSRFVKAAYAYLKHRADQLDVLTTAFLITYLALNVLGQTRGESGRLWIFMVPLFSLFAAVEVITLCTNKKNATFYLITLQLITTFMTFKFQDYW